MTDFGIHNGEEIAHILTDALRMVTLLWAIIFGAALAKFYLSKPRMPRAAVASMVCFLFFVGYVTWENFGTPFDWGESPVGLGALIAGTIGLWPYLTIRRSPSRKEST